MTEHDTPSPALVLTFQSEEDAAIALMQLARDDERRKVLAQARAGLQAVAPFLLRIAIEREDAMAVVDRLRAVSDD